MINKQPSLPFESGDIPARHDYGGEYDDGDFGHEFPFVQGGADEVPGVSVSLEDRAKTLHNVSKLYADAAQAKGLEKAVNIPTELSKLRERYGHDLGRVVAGAVRNSKYSLADERAVLEPILKRNELRAAGFDEADIDQAALSTVIEVRHSIGQSVGDAKRQENLAVADTAAKNARSIK